MTSAIDAVGLNEKRHQEANHLSGGEYQRMRIARALAQEPELLILDEPLAHLDPGHAHQLAQLLVRLNDDTGLTVFAAIHDLNIAALYFDRIILMSDGRILADGQPSEVMCSKNLELAFKVDFTEVKHPKSGRPQFLGSPK